MEGVGWMDGWMVGTQHFYRAFIGYIDRCIFFDGIVSIGFHEGYN